MLVPRAEPTKHDEQGTKPAKFLDMEVSAREVAAMADAMASAVAFMERFGRGQRLGETVITHTAIQHLIDDGDISKVLVVAPKKVAETTWSSEVEKWAHLQPMRVSVVRGTAKQSVQHALLENLKDLRDKYERTETNKHIS